ncbi:MAG TPA: NADH-quinone oxidoreductase subunit N [Acidimicrobiia bacterium]
MELDYPALAPEMVVAGTVVVVLILDSFLARPLKYWTGAAAIMGVTVAMIAVLVLAAGDPRSMLEGSWVVDEFALVLKALFLAAGYLVLLMSVSYIESDRYYEGEYYFLLLTAVLGAMIMASARDLILLFIGLELVSAPAFMLAGWRKGDVRSNEAALKFYLTGVLAVAILLYGMSFIYGLTGAVNFAQIDEAIRELDLTSNPAMIMALLFVITGFGFKISAVPFHFWAPDTYEGAPTPVTAFVSVVSKAAGFVGLLMVCYLAFPAMASVWGWALGVLAAVTMTVANLTALRQRNIVRLLAYSSVAQAGFMLVPFAVTSAVVPGSAAIPDAFSATVTYVVIYAFMNLGAFAIVIAGARKTGTGSIEGWAGLYGYAPGLAALAGVFFFSLAGIPPFAGWFAKFVMFRAIVAGGSGWTATLAAIAAVNAVVALYYYARVIKVMFMDPLPVTAPPEEIRSAPVARSLTVALAISVAVILLAGVFPQVLAYFGDVTQAVVAGG